jgi:hypothetical protein
VQPLLTCGGAGPRAPVSDTADSACHGGRCLRTAAMLHAVAPALFSAKTIASIFGCVAVRVGDGQRLFERWLGGIRPGSTGLYRWFHGVVSVVRLGGAEGFDVHDRFACRVGGVEVDAGEDREVVIVVGVFDDLAQAPDGGVGAIDQQQRRRASLWAGVDRLVLVPVGAERVVPAMRLIFHLRICARFDASRSNADRITPFG